MIIDPLFTLSNTLTATLTVTYIAQLNPAATAGVRT